MDPGILSLSLSEWLAGKIDGMEIGEFGFVPFHIELKLPDDSDMADGKIEYSASDSLDPGILSLSLSEWLAGKIDVMEIGEFGFVPFHIRLKLPDDSDKADGKNEYSTSDSLLSSLTVLPWSELLATNSAAKNYEIQKCLKLKYIVFSN